MKFFAILALAASAMAAPSLVERGQECSPPSYACKANNSGWLVCNVDGKWLDGGNCPAKTSCKPITNQPYCV